MISKWVVAKSQRRIADVVGKLVQAEEHLKLAGMSTAQQHSQN
jgi:hypothetical protein